jgi:hypothetical protein
MKTAAPWLFWSVTSLGFGLVCLATDYPTFAATGFLFAVCGALAAGLQAWPVKPRDQRHLNAWDILAEVAYVIADGPVVWRVAAGLLLLWVVATAGWVLSSDPLWFLD